MFYFCMSNWMFFFFFVSNWMCFFFCVSNWMCGVSACENGESVRVGSSVVLNLN